MIIISVIMLILFYDHVVGRYVLLLMLIMGGDIKSQTFYADTEVLVDGTERKIKKSNCRMHRDRRCDSLCRSSCCLDFYG